MADGAHPLLKSVLTHTLELREEWRVKHPPEDVPQDVSTAEPLAADGSACA